MVINMAENIKTEQDSSMEQILQTIRGVITGDGDDIASSGGQVASTEGVLDLTEMVNADGSVVKLEQAVAPEQPQPISSNDETVSNAPSFDVLSNIDNILAGENKSVPSNEEAAEPDVQEAPNFVPAIEAVVEIGKTAVVEDKSSEAVETKPESEAPKTSLVSEQTAIATSEVLKSLVKAVSKPAADGLGFKPGSTVEELIVVMVKPYLKEWLDTNLPGIVKHLVEKEIQKLIPREED